jgi:tetratricopeptide (TPR) repeat protein
MAGDYIMKETKIVFRLPDGRAIPLSEPLHALPWGILALTLFLFVGGAANKSLADDKKPKAAPSGQMQVYYVEDDEVTAYKAAKQEPDSQKRATKLMEFLRKYPKSPLTEASDYEIVRPLEDEYNAYNDAGQEPDYEKRSIRLIEFLQKYPKSTLTEQVDYEYRKMLKESSRDKKYELLESLAELWLKIRPDDRDIYALIAEATMNLKKYERCGECLEEIYRMQPMPSLAREIHTTYQKTENLSKQIKWAETLFKMPEFDADYMLRYGYVVRFSKDNNLPKAAEYSQLTLRSADLAEQKDADSKEQVRKVRRACHHVIATNLMEKGNFTEAISAFKRAVKAERYGQGYYKIGACLENQRNIEEAILYYAIAETMGEEDAPKAKSRLEVLYKVLHNDTLIGVDKVYKKAKDILAEPDNKL